jgi:hypothetical protein
VINEKSKVVILAKPKKKVKTQHESKSHLVQSHKSNSFSDQLKVFETKNTKVYQDITED